MNESDRLATIHLYVEKVLRELATEQATEHSYRPALKELLSALDDSIEAINEPKQSEHGAPDFVIIGKKNKDIKLGYGEAKIPGENLDKIEKSEQMDRYRGYANLFLTDCFDWRFYRNGEKIFEIKIGEVKRGGTQPSALYTTYYEQLADELASFLTQTPESIKSGKRLAEIMGGKARRIRDNVKQYLRDGSHTSAELLRIYEMMKQLLVHDLTEDKFADMYAQTLVYGLFVARYGDTTPESFDRSEARDLVPKSNPFLRHFFDHIVGPDFDARLGYIVDELCEVFSVSNVQEIVHKHLRIQDETSDAKDPIIHFYENFLQEYDPAERKKMGAYYTPTPVVKFIVRHVDKILKEEFGIAKGLASDETITHTVDTQPWRKKGERKDRLTRDTQVPRVQVLDPAVGTATFLNETIKFIYEGFKGQEGRWPAYVNDNLVKRLYGFELMMAPYTIAHLKLGMTLKETGVKQLNDRLGVYLTNTLEEGTPPQLGFNFGLAEAIAEESQLAAEVKSEKPVMVVMGNPPYSGVSSNETKYANDLIDKYKVEPGGKQKLQERKHWLNDDYVKFIAFAESMIAKNGSGIVAMITNNGYLENPTFRGMRWHLARSFDKIYCLDLHGSSKKHETTPDGAKDENVFNIMQGVSIVLAIKTSSDTGDADVYHADIYGKKADKFDSLNRASVDFKRIELDPKMYYFADKNIEGKEEYEQGIALNELMPINSTGIVTMGDSFIVGENPDLVADRVRNLANGRYSEDELNSDFGLGKNYAKYALKNANDLVFDANAIVPLAYRPFDTRYTYFDNRVIWRWREKVMKNMLSERSEPHTHTHTHTPPPIASQENIAMIFRRQQPQGMPFASIFMSEYIISDGIIRSDPHGGESVAPLYVYDGQENTSIAATRQQKTNEGFHHIFTTDKISESSLVSNKTGEISSQFPLYITQNVDGRRANFDESKLKELFSDVEQPDENSRKVWPEDIMDYIYASLHSPSYRETYKEFLKTDFPKVPRPESWAEFWRRVELGRELRQLHLMKSPLLATYDTTYSVAGDDVVEKISYEDGKVWINAVQYFGNVPETTWNFYIGGYQPAQKWLKDRKGRKLTSEDLDHYQKIIKILLETDRIMKQIG